MTCTLGAGALQQRIFQMPFHRDVKLDHNRLQQMRVCLECPCLYVALPCSPGSKSLASVSDSQWPYPKRTRAQGLFHMPQDPLRGREHWPKVLPEDWGSPAGGCGAPAVPFAQARGAETPDVARCASTLPRPVDAATGSASRRIRSTLSKGWTGLSKCPPLPVASRCIPGACLWKRSSAGRCWTSLTRVMRFCATSTN